eukprot:TRINITY_DN1974_c0_g1_i1.p1 TRINITY_DN1974_c0_g1~~TRINITY_DN1974_c0_g1_i1.p1  ORF type:complete len:146 (+),score=22.42 TRINITY_DN1974_c0_g1_i1:562-999(+)
MEEVRDNLRDYTAITIVDPNTRIQRLLSPSDTVAIHQAELTWIKEEIQKARERNLPVVVLTHHAPSLSCSEPDIPPDDCVALAFCSALDSLFVDPVVAWAFGHTHFPFDWQAGTCHLLSNPAGYPEAEFRTPYGREYKKKCVLIA